MRKLMQLALLGPIGLLLIAGCSTVQFGQGQLNGSGNVTSGPRMVAAFNAIICLVLVKSS